MTVPPIQNELTAREVFVSVQKSMANTDKALGELQAERREYRKLSDELLQEHAKYVDLLTKHMHQSKALMLDVIAQLKPDPAPAAYECHRETWCTPETKARYESAGWEVVHITDLLVIGNTGTGGDDDICTIVHFRRPATSPTAPETDEAEADLSAFEAALGDDDPGENEPNPHDTQEVEVVPELPEDDDGGETAPVEPVKPEPEREPAPVGYIEVTVSGCYLRGTHLQGNVFADVESQMVPVGMIERDRKTGRYIVTLEGGETLNMGGHDDLYRKSEARREPDSPTAIAPVPESSRINLGIGEDGQERFIENRVVWQQRPGAMLAKIDQDATHKLRGGAVNFTAQAVMNG